MRVSFWAKFKTRERRSITKPKLIKELRNQYEGDLRLIQRALDDMESGKAPRDYATPIKARRAARHIIVQAQRMGAHDIWRWAQALDERAYGMRTLGRSEQPRTSSRKR